MEPATARPRGLREAIDASVTEGMRLATLVLAFLLAFFVVVDLYITPEPWILHVAVADLAAALAFAAGHLALRAKRLRPHASHALGAGLAGFVALTSLLDTFLLADPAQTTYLMLVVVGAGSIFLHTRWLYAVVGITMGGWLLVANLRPGADWTTFGFALFAACVLSVLIHTVRLRTFERMERLRQAESDRKDELQLRETALESAIGALRESEERYRRLVEDAPDAFVVHRAGRILYVNPAAIELFGVSAAKELLDTDLTRLVHADSRDALRDRLATAARRQRDPLELRLVRADGTNVEVEALSQPIQYLGAPAEQTVLHDVTDRKRAEAERALAAARLAEISRLQEMDRMKTQFVNTVSHELRTPLTPLRMQVHILKKTPGQTTPRSIDVLERNIERLGALVDELLQVASIQAGTLKLAKTHMDLGETVQQVIDSYTDVAHERDIQLDVAIEPDLALLADPQRIQQVLYNLMNNALKFTPQGGRIRVETRRDGDSVFASVQDSGAGMDADAIARLFEPFSQVHDTMQQTTAGTGLGLFICRGILEGHGGRIWAESDGRGHGSRFAFTIPVKPA